MAISASHKLPWILNLKGYEDFKIILLRLWRNGKIEGAKGIPGSGLSVCDCTQLQGVSLATLNKDGRLIRADYVLANPRLAARSNIISLIRTPRRLFISFFLIATVLPSLFRRIMLTAFTRLRLGSDARRPTMLVLRRGVSGDTQVKPSFGVGSSV